MRTQTFGVEIEMTGITRQAAADVAAEYFGTTSTYLGGGYDKYAATDSIGRQWCFVSDSSIHVQSKRGKRARAVEMVTPILHYEDIEAFSNELTEKIAEAEKTKDLFGLNDMMKQEYNRIMQEKPESIFKREVSRALGANGFTVSENNSCIAVISDGKEIAGIYDNGMMSAPDGSSDDAYFEVKKIASTVSEYCSAYEKAPPLKATDLSGNYRSLAEFNGTVLAVKNTEYGFEFVTWDRTYDGNAVYHGNYYRDYEAAKENFAVRSELINKDKLFSVEELKSIHQCVDFTVSQNDDLSINECESLEKLNEKISDNIPEQQQSDSPEMSM